ncbi:carbonate dehydratase [Polychytrium aggregatum]|uniref:carbonate dehydratase n=1 Tax=Polychytrium aggregatum TaxID=110093 RepID=UPI0022FDF70F|nr:carbonate dehydratase [Polychytrium aggregatum]KAI9207375.1 carbonate dehydratase [Polychytrium aggregatum]
MMSSSVSELSKHNMNKFLSGFKRFHKNYFCDNIELFDHLRQAQSPKTLLIGCCDSRVDPAIITECDPGDMFVVRNVANLVAPYHPDGVSGFHGVSAAVEFAVKGLKVENIIVMGHTQCGGIKALMQGVSKDEYQFVGQWMSIVQLAKDKTLKNFPDAAPEVQQRACEHASILLSLENLMSYPWVKERLMKNEITINGWYFDFERGELLGYDVENNIFEPLVTFTENDSPTVAQ